MPLFLAMGSCGFHDLPSDDPLYVTWRMQGYGNANFEVTEPLPDDLLFPVKLEFIPLRDFSFEVSGETVGHFQADQQGVIDINIAVEGTTTMNPLVAEFEQRFWEDLNNCGRYEIRDSLLRLGLEDGEQMIFTRE